LKNAVKILYLHGRHIEKYLSRYYSPNTHLTGEALGLYYLGTQLPFLERAKHWRTLGENILLDEVTRQLHPDGVYFEQSTWYQRYTVDIFTQFLLLRSRNDGQILTGKGAELEVRLQRAYDFLMHSTFPNGRTPLIGDDDGGRLLPLTNSDPDDFRGTLAIGAVLFEQSGLRYVAGEVSQEVFWLQGPKRINDFESLPAAEPAVESASFPDGGYYIMRDGWSETDNCLMVDCGEVGALTGAHGHSDTLGIEVAIRGKTLLVDSGTFTYHDSAELRNYFRSSSAHNTLTIDGLSSSEPASAFNWKSRAQAEAHHWLSKPRFDFFKGSHTGYERFGDGATHTRSVLFIKGDYWIMRDFIGGTGSHEYSLDFHYAIDRKPVVEKDDRWIGDPDHRLFVFGDNGAWRQKESWVSNHHGSRDNASFLSYVSRGLGPQEFFTFILPVDSANEPMVQEAATTSGRAFFIKYDGYTDLFVFNDDSSQVVDNGVFRSNFEYSWARLRASESLPDEFILINGDRFAIGDKEMFESHEVNSASARRFGNELYIATDLGRTIKTL
jgi:hypothetical protein